QIAATLGAGLRPWAARVGRAEVRHGDGGTPRAEGRAAAPSLRRDIEVGPRAAVERPGPRGGPSGRGTRLPRGAVGDRVEEEGASLGGCRPAVLSGSRAAGELPVAGLADAGSRRASRGRGA